MKPTLIIASFLILAAAPRLSMSQGELCGVTTYFRDLSSNTELSSSVFRVAQFEMAISDDEFTKTVTHDESGVRISVGAQVVKGIFEKEPVRLRLKISFNGEPDDTYDSLDGVEAETLFDKNWRWLAISDEKKVASRIYTYTFGCARIGKKK